MCETVWNVEKDTSLTRYGKNTAQGSVVGALGITATENRKTPTALNIIIHTKMTRSIEREPLPVPLPIITGIKIKA